MPLKNANSKRYLFRVPLILVLLHAVFMLWVGHTWYMAVQEYGGVAGPEANRADTMVRWVDFVTYPVGQGLYETALTSTSPRIASFFLWLGAESFSDMILRFLWPLLFILGSIQWLLLGLGSEWAIRTVKRKQSIAR